MVQPGEQRQLKWLVTGAAGFIGYHLVDWLLRSGHTVFGVDNFITGKRERLDELVRRHSADALKNFEFVEGDLQDFDLCQRLCDGTDVVLHHAAIGSVSQSIIDPLATHRNNVDTFVNMLTAARDAKVKRFVYASSSAVYGDDPFLPKSEERIGRPLSPYATTKQVNELYAETFRRSYGLEVIGLRYFNVFGPWQDPTGPYAAVIPLWINAFLRNEPVQFFGDGLQTRDFCFISNVVLANELAAKAPRSATGHVYNIGCGQATSLLDLYETLRAEFVALKPQASLQKPVHEVARAGDILHSVADIKLARHLLGYEPGVLLREGLRQTFEWFAHR